MNSSMIFCALYARVSDQKQVTQDLSIPAQLKDMRKYAKAQGWHIYQEYTDEGYTGRRASSRPSFQQMISDAKAGKFQKIICHKIDRFARNREDSVVYKALLRRHGIDIAFVTENIEDSIYGRLIEGILEVFAEFYSLNLSAEVKKGQRETASRGYSTGGRPPYGYRKKEVSDESGARRIKWEPDPLEAPIVRRIFDMYVGGNGYKKIVDSLNEDCLRTRGKNPWSKTTIKSMLINPVYIGWKVYNRQNKSPGGSYWNSKDDWIINKSAHSPLIVEEVWEDAQVKMETTKNNYRKTEFYLLSGFTLCKMCGNAINGKLVKNNQGKIYRRYYCSGNERKGNCTASSIPMRALEHSVLEAIKSKFRKIKISKVEDILNRHSIVDEEIDIRRKRYKEHEKKFEILMEKFESGFDESFIIERMKKHREEMNSLTKQIMELESEKKSREQINIKTFTDYLHTIPKIISKMQPEELKDFLETIIERIEVDIENKTGWIYYSIPIQPEKVSVEYMPEVGLEPTRTVRFAGF